MTGRFAIAATCCAALLLGACASDTAGSGGGGAHLTHGGSVAVSPTDGASGSTTAGSGAVSGTGDPAGPDASASTTAQAHEAIDPCALLTKAEVDHAAGTKTGAPVRARDTCTYPTPTTAKFGQVNLFVGLGAKKIYDVDRKVLKHHFTAVPGIGDEAHRETGQIFFRVGKTWLAVQIARLDDADTAPLLDQLARAAAGRL